MGRPRWRPKSSSILRACSRRSCMRYLFIYTRLMTRWTGGVYSKYWKSMGWGGASCLSYPDPILGSGNNYGKGERILRGPLPGVPRCHPGVGLRTNVFNKVVVMYQPGPIAGKHFDIAYGRRMTSKGDPRHVRQSQRVVCEECGVELYMASMADHPYMQHRRSGQVRPLPQPLSLHMPK